MWWAKPAPHIEIGVTYGPKLLETRSQIPIIYTYVPGAVLCIEVSF